jgi:hypothetical protein
MHAKLLAIIILCLSLAVTAEEDLVSDTLFSSHEKVSINITFPYKELNKNRGIERPYHPGFLSYSDANGEVTTLDLQVRVRGKSRANKSTCKFPPIRLNFKKKQVEGTLFDGEDKLKLVTHCQSRESYEQYVLLEYLNYRVLEVLTDYTLKVRLFDITYYETGKEKPLAQRVGFILEDIGNMSKRFGLDEIKQERIPVNSYQQSQLNLVEVFEYFLGNTDWSVAMGPPDDDCCHNIIPLQAEGDSIIPVPYDFDSTGIVDAPYANVSEILPIKNVRQRLYRGFCQDDSMLNGTLSTFNDKYDDIMALYDNQAGLNDKTRKKVKKYIDTFYSTINDEENLSKSITSKCRQKS